MHLTVISPETKVHGFVQEVSGILSFEIKFVTKSTASSLSKLLC